MGQTRIGRSMRLTGEIEGQDDVVILGAVDGPIRVLGRLVVERRGSVRGECHARSVDVRGEIDGPVQASERIEIRPEGAVLGDLTAPRVLIADGARFEGQVHMERTDDRSEEDEL